MIQLYKWDRYKYKNRTYDGMGDFVLHPTAANLHLRINAEWELKLEVPILRNESGEMLEEELIDALTLEAVVSIDYPHKKHQLYVVDYVEKDEHIATCTCYPLFMIDAKNALIITDSRPTEKTGTEAIQILMTAANGGNIGVQYDGESDIDKINTAYYINKNLAECLNGGDENDFLKRWGGEIEYENYKVRVLKNIGKDAGLLVSSGFNMAGCRVTIDSSEQATALYIFIFNGREAGYINGETVMHRTAKTRFITYEDIALAEDIDNAEDSDKQIFENYHDAVQAAMNRARDDLLQLIKPKITYDIDMVDVSKTKEYEELKELTKIWLGDFVNVKNKKLNIQTKQEVVELEYDCITESITNIVLGQPLSNREIAQRLGRVGRQS